MPKPINNPNRLSFTGSASELRRRPQGRSGFTMLELMLVLSIVIVVAALAVPAVQGTISNQAIASGTDRVRIAMGQARVQAIRTGEVHALFYQRDGQWFEVAPLQDYARLSSQPSNGDRTSTQDRELSDNWLPRQVYFVAGETETNARSESARQASGGAPLDAVLFYPDGTAQDARLLLQDERGKTMAVELRGLTGMAKTIRKVSTNGQISTAR